MAIEIAEGIPDSVAAAQRMGDVTKLYDLARTKTDDARKVLSEEIVSILELEVSTRESELIADILIELLHQAEVELRQLLAEKLSLLDDVPLRLILQLANDEIRIAQPILKDSSVLGEMDLIYIIKSKSPEYWQAIAQRKSLSDQVINVLAETKDYDTALKLAENMDITLTDVAMTAISDVAQHSEVLALPLLRREEVPAELAHALYHYVGQNIKDFINKNYDLDKNAVSKMVGQAVEEFDSCAANAVPKDFMPEPHMVNAALSFKAKGLLTEKMMLNALRHNHVRSFVAQFSVFADMSPETVIRILSQNTGQGLAIIAKAHDFRKPDFISMFMLTSKLWNNGRIVNTSEVQKAVGYFDKATPEIAQKILNGKMYH